MLKNSEVQSKLGAALNALEMITDPKHKNSEIAVAKMLLSTIKEYSASGNSIPGLRGLGLEEALALADEVLSNGGKNLHINSKSIAQTIRF